MMFDVDAIIWGKTTDANLTDANDGTETKYTLAGALDPITLGVIIPAKQSDGTTDTAGTLTLAIKFYKDDGTTLIGTYTSEAIARSASGVVDAIRVGRPRLCTKIGITPTVSVGGNLGVVTLGLTLGAPQSNSAG